MATGTVKRVIRDRYGFVNAQDGTEMFFHRSDLMGVDILQLPEGRRVDFDLEDAPKGPRAARVRVADDQTEGMAQRQRSVGP